MVDLHHGSVFEFVVVAWCFSWAQFTSELEQMGLARFFSPVPFWEDRVADPKCCPFPGWEEAKHEGRQGGEGPLPKSKRGEHIDIWWQLPERWVTVTPRSPSLPLPGIHIVSHLFPSWGETWKSFGLFHLSKTTNWRIAWIYSCVYLTSFSARWHVCLMNCHLLAHHLPHTINDVFSSGECAPPD